MNLQPGVTTIGYAVGESLDQGVSLAMICATEAQAAALATEYAITHRRTPDVRLVAIEVRIEPVAPKGATP